jgi:hypothetical protein
VLTLDALDRVEVTYNFTVADFHTYFAGQQKVFVHNNNGCACVKVASAAVKSIIGGTRGLEHSFDRHAAEWFGREVLSASHLRQWQTLVERAALSSKKVDWSVGDAATIGHLARIEGKNFFVQFYKDGPRAGELATAFIPNQGQVTAILGILGK